MLVRMMSSPNSLDILMTQGASHPRSRHHEVIALDAVLDAAEKLADVAEFLPRDAFHKRYQALAESSAAD